MKTAKAASTAAKRVSAKSATRTTRENNGDLKTSKADAIELLKADHRKVEKLFAQCEADAGSPQKAELVKQICSELIIHTIIEEEIFYAACREGGVEDDGLDEAQVEHDGAKVVIADLLHGSPEDAFYDAKITVLSEYIKHHVREEEKPRSGIFAKAKKAEIDMSALGAKLQARKTELLAQGESLAAAPLQARSLHLQEIQSAMEDTQMPRYSNQRDRDDQGRFASDDDDRSYRGRSYAQSGRSSSRGGNGNRERDEQGRFMSDDDEDRNYSRSSRGSYENRGGNTDRERDDQGRFMSDDDGRYSSRGRSSRSSQGYDEDEEDRSRARDYASRPGRNEEYDEGRNYSRGAHGNASDRDRDEQGRFTSDDDRNYGRSSRGGRSSSEDRGWYGDSQGHADAGERGRGGGRSSRDDEDEENRSSRSSRRGQSYSSRGGSSSSSRGRSHEEEGHGGWFGDSRGHAEAARRGWQSRD